MNPVVVTTAPGFSMPKKLTLNEEVRRDTGKSCVCIDASGHVMMLGEFNTKNWVKIQNPTLREAVRKTFKLEKFQVEGCDE